ncbi:intracellular adhesion protein IcaD [Mammaliicoccus lentus]|uniref:intracellular adhesion protein IcaD n=1 Tax=Mammaliicoccus lentus TaxID=42858 RepID=UPI003A599192
MVESGQRESKKIDSRLNIYREFIVFMASSILWLYCITVLFVMVGSLLPYNNHIIQTVRFILNIEKSDIITIFTYFIIASIVIIIYLMLSFLFNVKRKRVSPYENS